MKSYLKLVNFEMKRFFKLYVILMILTIVSQIFGAIYESKLFMKNAELVMFQNQLSVSEYIEEIRGFSLYDFTTSGWIVLSVFFCIAILMLYVFFIWYRDWFGKNTFIYRLLTLPTKRVTIYLAKLTTIMLLVFGLIALQIILFKIQFQIVKSIIPVEYRIHFTIYDIFINDIWTWMVPKTFAEFILIYGMGLIFVAVLFTAILFERSFRLKGIFFAIIYVILSVVVFIAPLLVQDFYKGYFYSSEIFAMEIVTGIIVLGSAIWIANYLLKHKIRV